jgi:integrase
LLVFSLVSALFESSDTNMLTDVAVRKAKPSSQPRKISDGGGLHVLVQPTGSKLWRLAYRFAGKQKTLAIGVYPIVSLEEARRQRENAKKLLARSIDPSVQRRADRQAGKQGTFRAVADEVLVKHEREGRADATLSKKHWLLAYAFPAFGDRPVAEITARELLALLRELEGRGLYETARRLRSTCGMVFRYAIATGRAERDPSMDLRGALTTPQVVHRATIVDPTAIAALLRAVDGFDGQPTTRAALRLAPYVFVRPGELRQAEWSEFDLDAALWSIPAKKNEDEAPPSCPVGASIDSYNPRAARRHWRGALAIPFGTHVYKTNFRKHVERRLTSSRLWYGGDVRPRL